MNQPPPGWPSSYGAPRHETTFLNEPGLVITSTRAIVGSTMYPMNGITSVRAQREARSVAPFLAALGLGLVGILLVAGGQCRGAGVFTLLFAAGCGLLYAMGSDRWWVVIGTAGGEVRAVCYAKEEQAQRVVGALNHAIVSRG